MSAVDDEFTISFELSVSSKRLKKTCLLEHHMVNGVSYVPLIKRSKLALLVGQCKGGKYFEDTNVVEYVQEKRNDAVTQAMLKKSLRMTSVLKRPAPQFQKISAQVYSIDIILLQCWMSQCQASSLSCTNMAQSCSKCLQRRRCEHFHLSISTIQL